MEDHEKDMQDQDDLKKARSIFLWVGGSVIFWSAVVLVLCYA